MNHRNTAAHRAASGPRRGRFAPSPTGDLHAGSLLAALGSWLLARAARGEWWVRIEDLDPPREIPGCAQLQLEALSAMGLHPDAPVVRQSRRGSLYQQALDYLLDNDLAFACHCSRADVAACGGIHRECRARARRRDPSIRLRVPDRTQCRFVDAIQGPQSQDVAAEVGDFVLRRADGLWAYQLAVVVDDAAQAVTDVVRGADLLDSTPRQILLQRALGLPTPRYAHLPLVLDAQGRKLSKSDRAHPLDPADPLPALRQAWEALGQDPHALDDARDPEQLLHCAQKAFRASAIPRATPPEADLRQRTMDLSQTLNRITPGPQ
ncbi:MAG: tRNA glutamyl-Q(34) synthetase GluQRS [Pseudomonadota bacterium]|nr:tRNA glutamyl-Q(34) synthetase GluQRS [Pseudomonadota bacterium]